ncbi:hypothetical protein JCM19235_2131 [Vibrio maritimus]|uniref:Uncharacterized protein n=1 Tax=Vibrio maritimus TaxID=990268 RepID=A0A090RVU4_9VIBR|nr:hypothetical protein JCM19235_2131 [Vibrio maritimus]
MKSVMIADDHLIVAQGIASLLESTYKIVAVLESGEAY